jgi:hypothetical protein
MRCELKYCGVLPDTEQGSERWHVATLRRDRARIGAMEVLCRRGEG